MSKIDGLKDVPYIRIEDGRTIVTDLDNSSLEGITGLDVSELLELLAQFRHSKEAVMKHVFDNYQNTVDEARTITELKLAKVNIETCINFLGNLFSIFACPYTFRRREESEEEMNEHRKRRVLFQKGRYFREIPLDESAWNRVLSHPDYISVLYDKLLKTPSTQMVAEEYVDPHGDYGYTESPLKVLFSYELKLAALDKRVALPYRIRKYCKPPWDCIWKDNGTQHERINCNIVYRTNVEKYVDFWQPMVQKSISTIKEGDEDVVPYLSFLVGVGCELASAFCEKYDEIYQCKVMRSGELKPKDYSVYSKLMNLEADILRFLHGEYMKVGTPEDDCFKENKRLILLDQISRIYRTNGMKFITSCYSDGGFKENLEFVRDFFREIYHRKKGDYEKNRMWDFHRVGITGPAYSDYYCGQPLFFFIERHGGSYSVALDMKLRPRP